MTGNPNAPDQPTPPAAGSRRIDVTPAAAIDLAGRHYQQRRFAEAERISRSVIAASPDFAHAHNLLGAALAAQGRRDEAIASLKRSVELEPRAANVHANLGEILRQAGRLDEARAALGQAVAADPANGQALNNLGIVEHDLCHFEAAAGLYRRAIALDPALPEAHNNLANALRQTGDRFGALSAYDRALALRPNYAEAHGNRGTLLRELRRDGEAEQALRSALRHNPMHVDAVCSLAGLLAASAREEEGLALLNQALRFAPANPQLLIRAAIIHLHRNALAAAEAAAEEALEGLPGSPDALTILGQVYHDSDRYNEAVDVLEQAIAEGATAADTFNLLGVALKSVGRFDEARERLLEALDKDQPLPVSYFNLADLVDFGTPAGAQLVDRMERALAAAADGDAEELVPLRYAYAKALDDLGRPEEAFDHYVAGGRSMRSTIEYREAETLAAFDSIRSAFPAAIFRDRPFAGMGGEQLVFIVGMPRSGSTLVEQILASHRDIAGAGEVKHLGRALAELRRDDPSLPPFPALVAMLSEPQFEMIGEHYLAAIGPALGGSTRVTDKLLTNHFFVGLIHLLFPRARIINTVRDPIDGCVSAFTKLFKDDMPYSYDLGELGRFHVRYAGLMDHWRSVLPAGVMTTVRYEDVVADVAGEARRLVDFLGLDWDPACLDFHRSTRPVRTASVAQVRKAIYSSSVGRWTRYGDRLEPLLEALAEEGAGALGKKKA